MSLKCFRVFLKILLSQNKHKNEGGVCNDTIPRFITQNHYENYFVTHVELLVRAGNNFKQTRIQNPVKHLR